jgi:serine/threonine protein kinase
MVDETYVFPRFDGARKQHQTIFKSAWEWTTGSAHWKPCIIKISTNLEFENARTLVTAYSAEELITSHLVPVHSWQRRGDSLASGAHYGVLMPRYLGVLSEFTGTHLRVNSEVIFKITNQISGAIAALHRINLVHMDVKPSNIFLDGEASGFLGDFGSLTAIGDGVTSYSPAFAITELQYETADPVHDWLGLLLTGLLLVLKLLPTGDPHPVSVVVRAINSMRGDKDPCYAALVNLFDERIKPVL